ncbi:30S ribosomal protein S1 [Clostridium luticellarii]|uniref:30S ribosomal protein S1 n=1 Tax=Clostridium luticellarii TaxID=1691940 RepID=UPI00235477CE|nr:30S ribosomal protein S1 [Clostridium luticellarii]MCI1944833.1 30S ribosomal protein S1 [Clostridium luticellarii]MCI1968351.1 30S ribosomal protein S1 [Clostridium luticellarii]MCI1995349.1 30S ribosomal protein S1 [Clostridium luticellarii]MCI2039389.1 30S ribosomal protein S1 [Clostridium luticellarii]
MTGGKEVSSMDEVMGEIDSTMENVKSGEVVKGKIISINDKEAVVNIGYVVDGVLPKSEICKEDSNIEDFLKVGDEIYVYIVSLDKGEEGLLLSKLKADIIMNWNKIENLFKEGKTVDVIIKEVVKGGVLAELYGLRAFIPASQISVKYVANLSDFLNKTLSVKIIELDKNKNKIVLSGKEAEKLEIQKKAEKLWSSIKKGEEIGGIVSRITGFGAFIDLGGVEGLAHISELSWKRIKNPSEVVSVGDHVKVTVLDMDRGKNRISLSMKNQENNPWNGVSERYKLNDIVEGTVVKMINVGAFVEIEPGLEGFVHVSEISQDHIGKPSDVLNVGDKVKVKILNVDAKARRISLSIKEAAGDSNKKDFKKYTDDTQEKVTLGDLFKDKLKNMKFD